VERIDDDRIKTLERRVAALEAHIGLTPTFTAPDPSAVAAAAVAAPGIVQLGDGRTAPAPSTLVTDFMRTGKVINAIKQYRGESGLSLADAKHVIDNYRGY
jgi:ribosomal protein L7/L12